MKWLTTAGLVVAFAVLPVEWQQRIGLRLVSTPAAGTLIEAADLTCNKVFLSPDLNTGKNAGRTHIDNVQMPTAFRYEGATRYYFVYESDGDVRYFAEPTGQSCATARASITQATWPGWGGNWGQFPVAASDGGLGGNQVIPGEHETWANGLYWDDVLDKLVLSWYPSYNAVLTTNSFAAATLDDGTHTLSVDGCWGVPAYNTLRTGGSMFRIPSSFVSANLSAGRDWVLSNGAAAGYDTASTYGPVMVAIDVPSGNACASNTDYDITSSTLMELHARNGNGPHCEDLGVGCTPSTTNPTTPYPAEMSFADYSITMYAGTWEPYGGHGWFTNFTNFRSDWYDDGVKQGVVAVMATPAGWLNQTVLASPVPSAGSFSVTSLDTHDGYVPNPGDLMWVQTCTPGVDSGCSSANLGHMTEFFVGTVNAGTGAITYTTVRGGDTGGVGVPVVGGPVWFGGAYKAGSPVVSRTRWRLQIYDPDQYAEVIASTRQSYNVKYVEEIDFTSVMHHFGSPADTTNGGVRVVSTPSNYVDGGAHGLGGLMADPSANQIIVSVNNGKTGIGVQALLFYVFDVAQGPPPPFPFLSLGILAGVMIVPKLRRWNA